MAAESGPGVADGGGTGSGGGVPVLAGFTVAVTAERRADELAALLQRRGANVLRAPTLRIVPLGDDAELLAATRHLLDDAPDIVVATTAVGFRGWLEAAAGWGLGERLARALRAGELVARGPKASGAIRAAGLRESWSPESESIAEVRRRLLERDLRGRRVAVQLHGEPMEGFTAALREAGAGVVEVPVYRWLPPADWAPVDRLVDAVAGRTVDAVSFTSAPAATSLLARARDRGRLDAVLDGLRSDVPAVCVGPVTAGPLLAHHVPVLQPERARLAPLVQLIAAELPARARRFTVAGRALEMRGQAVVVDGVARAVPPAGMALLRALVRRPGWVVSRDELLRVLPGAGRDGHAVETAMARLRSALGAPDVVQTVVKRGYRLALDPRR